MTPTIDHTDRSPRVGCSCAAELLCAHCYARVERHRAERQLDEWLERFGLQVARPVRVKPVLRLVR